MRFFWRSLPASVALTIVFLSLYVLVMLEHRQGMDDPQVQVANDIALRLEAGADPKLYIPALTHDMARSLSVFISLYDGTQTLIGSSGLLDGSPVTPPADFFAHAKERGEIRASWSPRDNVRVAAVMRHVEATTTTYVLVGRSMREGDSRMSGMSLMILVSWLVSLAGTLCALWVADRNLRP